MIKTDLLKKYIAGDASQEEKEKIQLWLEADQKNMKEFIALRTLYDITLANLEKTNEQENTVVKSYNLKKLFREAAKIAAVVLVAIGISYTLFLNFAGSEKEEATMQTLFVPAGQRAELTLADGTVVWLNAQTTLTFPNKFGNEQREVFLNGEAYFNVAKDEAHKFIVNTKFYNINVLGTEFNVSAYNKFNYFETSLLKGSIEVVSKSNKEKKRLIPGERVYIRNNTLITDSIIHHDYFLWKEGIISFEHERFEDILNKLRVIYGIDIQNYNKFIIDSRYNGKFHIKDGIEHALNVLKIAIGFQYKKDDEKNIISIW